MCLRDMLKAGLSGLPRSCSEFLMLPQSDHRVASCVSSYLIDTVALSFGLDYRNVGLHNPIQ